MENQMHKHTNKLLLCGVSDKYINYLLKQHPHVYSGKSENRNHNRKYLGVLFSHNGFNYYAPLSSPKPSDYKDGKIRKSTLCIKRIVVEDKNGNPELKGTIRLGNMIPVPLCEVQPYDLKAESDLTYKIIVEKQQTYIRQNTNDILKCAFRIYNLKINEDRYPPQEKPSFLNATLDFKGLENLCTEYEKVQTAKVKYDEIKSHAVFREYDPLKDKDIIVQVREKTDCVEIPIKNGKIGFAINDKDSDLLKQIEANILSVKNPLRK